MNMIDTPSKDYDMVRRSLAFMTENWRDQPSLDAIAEKSGVSPHHMQRVFTRWAGLSPKAFLQAVTIDHARELLRDSASILDTAYEVGLSGPGRLHDLFVTHEGMSPGIYKARGKGLVVRYGFHDSPFGLALVMTTDLGLCGLAFADAGEEKVGTRRHDGPLARGGLCRRHQRNSPRGPAHFRDRSLATRPALACRVHRHRFRNPRVGNVDAHSASAGPRPIPISPPISESPVRRVPSAPLSARTRYHSSSRVTGCLENPAASVAITGASPASVPSSAGKRASSAARLNPELRPTRAANRRRGDRPPEPPSPVRV